MNRYEIAKAWREFFMPTVVHDADMDDKKTVRTSVLMEYQTFGQVMALLKDGPEFPLPEGTEDRIWVRAFLAVRGHKEYKVELLPHRETFSCLEPIRQALIDIGG